MQETGGAEGMNSEKIAEFNRKCAEYMDWPFLDYDPESGAIYCGDLHSYAKYDPYHDANDRNKLIEKMGIETFCIVLNGNKAWTCGTDSFPKIYVDNISMEAAQIACIASVLGVNQ